ncbi:hypothetical protein EDB84DRAFT_488252 [Lactarius hengduanensis]|nr:hypothetical protein EDB84DRAFT_488252 [Lactarius hengduanensis]
MTYGRVRCDLRQICSICLLESDRWDATFCSRLRGYCRQFAITYNYDSLTTDLLHHAVAVSCHLTPRGRSTQHCPTCYPRISSWLTHPCHRTDTIHLATTVLLVSEPAGRSSSEPGRYQGRTVCDERRPIFRAARSHAGVVSVVSACCPAGAQNKSIHLSTPLSKIHDPGAVVRFPSSPLYDDTVAPSSTTSLGTLMSNACSFPFTKPPASTQSLIAANIAHRFVNSK